jgi:hypothetical protein
MDAERIFPYDRNFPVRIFFNNLAHLILVLYRAVCSALLLRQQKAP